MECIRRLTRVKLHQFSASPTLKIPSCCASTGGKSNTRNKKQINRKRYRGIKVDDGDYVHSGYILAAQIHRFKFYPGSNVMVGKNMTLTSLVSGTVRITREIFVPNPQSELAQVAKDLPIGAMLYKLTVNVLQDKEVGVFKLKEQI
ncbi:large ribosomal subunit protein bL27m-like [Styela clava]